MKSRRSVVAILTLALALLLVAFHERPSAAMPRFFDDDPAWTYRDTQDAGGVVPWEIDLVVDLTFNLFGRPGDPALNVRAKNTNTVDEVPDSSWFTNRLGYRPVSVDEVAKGPNQTMGPAPGVWTVISSKSDGVTPGFTIRDPNRQLWFLKFDAPRYRAMATGTEVAVTKLFWALGYHVPENYIAYLDREQLAVGDGANVTLPNGRRRQMRLKDIATLLRRANPEPDGRYRVVASKALEGMPLGGFRFYGTRPDDPNDVVPHEHRRELRGYGVFAAWLNHVDAKAINSMDTLVRENGRSFVRHNLLDFGSTLGSGALAPREFWEGHEYLVEGAETGKQMMGFGFRFPAWHTKAFEESRAMGRLPANNTEFDPEGWKPRVPNPAFIRARADDKFWAATKLAAMTDDMLRAAIRAGDFGDANAETFLVKALAERRNAILRTYLTTVNPVVAPALDANGRLTFRNAAVDAGVASPPRGYRAAWAAFDNATGSTRPIGDTEAGASPLQAPAGLPAGAGAMVRVDVSAVGGAHPSWETPVRLYFRQRGGQWLLVGLERIPDAAA